MCLETSKIWVNMFRKNYYWILIHYYHYRKVSTVHVINFEIVHDLFIEKFSDDKTLLEWQHFSNDKTLYIAKIFFVISDNNVYLDDNTLCIGKKCVAIQEVLCH